MLNIKKVLTIRIISLLVSISMAFPSSAYSLPEKRPDSLRVPLNAPQLAERQQEAQRRLLLEKHNLSRFLTQDETATYLATVDEVVSIHTGRPMSKTRIQQLIEKRKASIAERDDGTKVVVLVSPIDTHLEADEQAVGGVTYMGEAGESVIHMFDPAPVFDFNLARRIRDRYLQGTPLEDSEGKLATSVYRVKQLLGEEGTEDPKSTQELIEMADEDNVFALVALEVKGAVFSIHSLRPGWTFEPIADAYKSAIFGNYEKAYELLLEGLLGEDYVVNIKTAIGVLKVLTIHYGVDTEQGREVNRILEIVTQHQKAKDQTQMKTELKQALNLVAVDASEALYSKIANWIIKELRLSAGSIRRIVRDLKSGKVIFENNYNDDEGETNYLTSIDYNIVIDLSTGLKKVHKEGYRADPRPWDYGYVGPVNENYTEDIPREIFFLAKRVRKRATKPPSVGHVEPVADAYTALQAGRHDEAYDLVMEGLLGEDYVVNIETAIGVLRALIAHYKADSATGRGREIVGLLRIVKRYKDSTDQTEMKKKLRETKKGFKDLRKRLEQARLTRKKEIESERIAYGNLFKRTKDRGKKEKLAEHMLKQKLQEKGITANIGLIKNVDVKKAVYMLELFGDFAAEVKYQPRVTREEYWHTDYGFYGYADSGELSEVVVQEEKYEIQITPLTNLSNLKAIPALFWDIEVLENPSSFEEALRQLKTNEGNIPVVLLTQETEDTIRARLRGIDLTGVQFRTLAELGLQDFKLVKVMGLIVGIEDLRVVPLTDALTDAYDALKKARDQV